MTIIPFYSFDWNTATTRQRKAWLKKAGAGQGEIESQSRLDWWNLDPMVKKALQKMLLEAANA